MIKKVYIDTDIILDLIQERKPYYHHSAKLFSIIDQKKINGFVSPLIFANLYYIIRKERSSVIAVDSLLRLKMLLKILPVNERIIELALSSNFKDFEDAIQYYTAIENKIDYLVTRNKRDYKVDDIIVCNAKELIDLLKFN